jgi:hypothetical protein
MALLYVTVGQHHDVQDTRARSLMAIDFRHARDAFVIEID